jgi:polysaccharide pyruvyl transferase WcaK-like protein
MTPQKILLIEAYTDANIGSGALVENSVKLLRKKYPDSEIRVMAHYPNAFATLCQVEAVPDFFFYPFGRSRIQQFFWLIRTVFWMAVIYAQLVVRGPYGVRFFKNKIKDLLWADTVVSVGAERINDKFIKNIVFSLYTYLIVKKMKKKMVLFPCTIGPFLFRWTKWLTVRVLRMVDIIFTRDDLSYEAVCTMPGLDHEKVINTSDVAVIQTQIPADTARKMIGVQESDQIVGISAIKWTYVANSIETPYSNYKSYVRQMAKLADTIISKHKVTVVFYPTNYPLNGCREDDLSTAREIVELMSYKNRTHIIDFLPSPSQLKGMLACSNVNITTRMHACIFSTGAVVPTISVNYLFKIKEYMKSIGLKNFSIDIEQFNADLCLAAFNILWNDQEKWRKIIQESLIEKQQRLFTSLERLDPVIKIKQPPTTSW